MVTSYYLCSIKLLINQKSKQMKTLKSFFMFLINGRELKPGTKYTVLSSNI